MKQIYHKEVLLTIYKFVILIKKKYKHAIKTTEFKAKSVVVLLFYYGLRIETLSPNAQTARIKSITNGAVYPPLEMSRLFEKFAINAATIRLKFVRL